MDDRGRCRSPAGSSQRFLGRVWRGCPVRVLMVGVVVGVSAACGGDAVDRGGAADEERRPPTLGTEAQPTRPAPEVTRVTVVFTREEEPVAVERSVTGGGPGPCRGRGAAGRPRRSRAGGGPSFLVLLGDRAIAPEHRSGRGGAYRRRLPRLAAAHLGCVERRGERDAPASVERDALRFARGDVRRVPDRRELRSVLGVVATRVHGRDTTLTRGSASRGVHHHRLSQNRSTFERFSKLAQGSRSSSTDPVDGHKKKRTAPEGAARSSRSTLPLKA
jgi:hypothetical protein